ncbi:unnamed protein product [Brassicogethes aeneus]|uniref:G-protein coupled receptors family 2 profile 2 domain-containing protein n=1 Tax=Brassicogethes aeneus TaxID=1431903 RepID=A0A9P0FJ78_BRAAE|nr:unnamed protein product [Brassicogethes aeneus]
MFLEENATRECFGNATWQTRANYDACTEIPSEDFEDSEVHLTIYFVGYTASLISLLLAIGIFTYFKELRCLRNIIHMNLMWSYVLFCVIYICVSLMIVFGGLSNTNCIYFATILNFAHLTTFFWMFVEGLYLYILVVETLTRENFKLRIYVSIGWVTPILVVLALNMIFLIAIMWVLITKLRSANSIEAQQYHKASKALLVLMPLLGITYVIILWFPIQKHQRLYFDIFRAGFTVALLYCFLNTEVKNAIRHHFENWKANRSLGPSRNRSGSRSKDWSPRSRTESIRLYSQPTNIYHKRESSASEVTTTTLITVNGGSSRPSNGSTQARSPFLQPPRPSYVELKKLVIQKQLSLKRHFTTQFLMPLNDKTNSDTEMENHHLKVKNRDLARSLKDNIAKNTNLQSTVDNLHEELFKTRANCVKLENTVEQVEAVTKSILPLMINMSEKLADIMSWCSAGKSQELLEDEAPKFSKRKKNPCVLTSSKSLKMFALIEEEPQNRNHENVNIISRKRSFMQKRKTVTENVENIPSISLRRTSRSIKKRFSIV